MSADPKELAGITFDRPERVKEILATAPAAEDDYADLLDPPDDGDEKPAPKLSPQPEPKPKPKAQAQPEPSMLDRVRGYLGDAGQGAADLARGLGRGVSFDSMASLSAAATPEVDDGTGIPRMYRAGSATADLTAQNRREDAEAQARSPILTAAGMGLGMAPAAIASTAAAGPAGMVAAPVAMGAMMRGGSADTAQQFARRTFDPAAVATDATIGMAVPAAIQGGVNASRAAGAVREAAPQALEQLLESQPVRAVADRAGKIAQGAGEVADNLRFGSYGARGSDVRAVANARGVDHVGNIARESEAMGLDKSSGMLSSSWKDALKNSDKVINQTGKDIGAWLDKLSQPGKQGIKDTELAQMFDDYASGLASGQYGKVDAAKPLIDAVRKQAETLRERALGPLETKTTPAHSYMSPIMAERPVHSLMNEREAVQIGQTRIDVPAETRKYRPLRIDPETGLEMPEKPMTIAQANQLKGAFNDEAFKGMRALDSTKADANRAMGGITRDAIMTRAKESDPVAADALAALYRKYDIASSVKDAAQQRVLQESGNLQPSMYAVIGGAGGGVPGAVVGQLAKIKGAQALANGGRAIQRGAERVQRAMTPAVRGAELPFGEGPARAPFPEPLTEEAKAAARAMRSAPIGAMPGAAAALEAESTGAAGEMRDSVGKWLGASKAYAQPTNSLDTAMQSGGLGEHGAKMASMKREDRVAYHTRMMATDPEYRRKYTAAVRASAEDDTQ